MKTFSTSYKKISSVSFNNLIFFKFVSRYTPAGLFHLVSHYTKWFWGKCEGVDPNRNFDYHWGQDKKRHGASTDPCHETYEGPKAFSEPETKAMADYIMSNRHNIK